MKSPIILRIFKNNQLVEVKQFESDVIIFGNKGEVNVDLDDETVSTIHCLVELRDSGYYLCDMGSASGTRKNGNAVLDEAISSGDNIEVGPFRIQFFVGAPKPKATPLASVAPEVAPAPAAKSAEAQKGPQAASPPVPSVATVASVAPVVKTNIPIEAPLVTAKPPKLPDSTPGAARHSKSKKSASTFAPGSEIKDLGSYLQPTKGPVVEVIVAWRERILSTYHFGSDQSATIGSGKRADIFIPSNYIKGVVPFLDMKGGCRVAAPVDMFVEMTNSSRGLFTLDDLSKSGKSQKGTGTNVIRLDQGELLRLTLDNGNLQIFVRYVANTIRPILAPPLDLSAGELTGLVVSLVIVALTALYMSVYTPPVAEEKPEEQVRLAQFIYNKPPPTPKEPEPESEKKEVVEVKPPPPQEPKKIKVTDEKIDSSAKPNKNTVAAAAGSGESGRASEVRPNPANRNRPKKFTSTKQGGSTKMGDSAGANAQSNKDVSKVGLLSAFGGGGVRKQLDQAYSGSGELLGMANEATGRSGQNENRAGDDIGSRFKDTGAGGKGTATQGIAGIGTKGRGSGMSSYGSGMGLGGKGNVSIDAGGADEGWEGTIDREAVRRVIRSILNQIKSCYERQLRVNSSLEGKVVIQFEIMEQGRVRTAKTKSSTLSDATVETCVAARIREARFPEPPTGTIAVVDYPFVFGAQR